MPNFQPLSGIRVLDLTAVLAGPFASYQLSLQGAEVIKIEMPKSGELARQLGASSELNSQLLGASFVAQNSGKKSIAVNLKSDSGKKILRELIKDADVLIENFRPGVLARLGFSYGEMKQINPGIVYCAISGFGQTGPLKDRPAYDQIIQGMSGMMSVTGTEEHNPLRAGFPVADTLGGISAAYAISSALVSRASTGVGCEIDVSMLEAAITAMGWVVSNHLLAGSMPKPMGNENFTAAPSGTFQAQNGYLNISANKQEQFEALSALLNRADLMEDSRFAAREQRKIHRQELKAEIESVLETQSVEYWVEQLSAQGIPCGPVLNISDAITHEQIQGRKLIHQVPNPVDSETDFHVVGNPLHFNGQPSTPQGGPPLLGEHTAEILREIGYSEADIASLQQEGAIK